MSSQGASCEGDLGIIVLCTMFLVSFSINVSIFHSTRLDTCWTGLLRMWGRHLWWGRGVQCTKKGSPKRILDLKPYPH